ncbi:hypothetical protein JKP88DRAFT_255616 [Tribonema minus]|uniref:Homing endonuclease LAGLIDADG domain-containing protein n=1 Tax=Tribonema minus TaxID=303371 RepID=A0A836CFQ7_9STRA|nr:hypothetical protein JKP88DRAFT_255616 [Tribonema minus]
MSLPLDKVVFCIASQVFDAVTPLEQQTKISAEQVEYQLQKVRAAVNSTDALKYLTCSNGIYAQQITAAIAACMKDVLADRAITLADVPTLMRCVRTIAESVSHVNSKRDAAVQIGEHSIIPLLKMIVLLVAQMILPAAQFEIANGIFCISFDLLATRVEPLLKAHGVTNHAYVFDPRIPHVTISPTPSDEDLEHAAGFLEGDACIRVGRTSPSIIAVQTAKKKDLLDELRRIFGVGVIEKTGDETETRTEKWQWRCSAAESIAIANLIRDRLIQKAAVARVMSKMEPVVGFGRNTQYNRDRIVEYNTIKREFISLDDLDIIARMKGTSVKYTDLVNSGLEFREMSVHYVAGFFEAEGSMTLAHNKRSRDDVHNLVVQIAQKDMYILYLILAYLKVGIVNTDGTGGATYKANGSYGIQVLKHLRPFVRSAAIKEQIRIILEEGVNANTKLKLVQYKAKRRAP